MTSTDGGVFQWKADAEWDKPMVETKERERYDEIDKWLFYPGLLCRIYGGEYMFVDTANYWCNLASTEAVGRLNTMVGILNATVNIDKSAKQFHKYIVKRCNVNVGKPIPTSVCFGTRRLEIVLDEMTNEILFSNCRVLLNVISKNANPAVSTACIMPIDTDTIPTRYAFPGRGEILISLMKLFPDLRSLYTILWHIGNSLVDPVSRPRCLMLSGPGGSGKSRVLQHVFSCLTGCCGILPDGSLVQEKKSMPDEVAEVVASCRMAVCYDVDLESRLLDMSTFKNISGSDYIRVGYNSVKSNCSLMLATNGVVNIDKQPEYLQDAIIRRTSTVLMNVNALDISPSSMPEDSESRVDFACAAIQVRLQYDSMPISPLDFLLSICQSKIDIALQHIYETRDPISLFDGLLVLNTLSKILNVSRDSITFKAKLISPLTLLYCNDRAILRGLKTK